VGVAIEAVLNFVPERRAPQTRFEDFVVLAFAGALRLDAVEDASVGLPPYAPGYTPGTDRKSIGPNVWNLGRGDGLERVDDILNIVKQYFHDCA
jgi:hypothetical protein